MTIIGNAFVPPKPEPWMEQGLCRQVGPIFYPEKGERAKVDEAKSICRRCDVREQCLEYALTNHERFGIWGMTSERERRTVLRDRRRSA